MKGIGAAGLVLLLASGTLSGCLRAEESAAEVDVLATFYPLAFVATRIAADDLRVATFVPAGSSPLLHEPTPAEALRASRASLVLYNGAGLEPWIDTLRRASPHARFVAATQGVAFVDDEGFPEDFEGHGAPDDHGAFPLDPHVWLDPLRMKAVADNVARAFSELDPDGSERYYVRAEALKANLDALHRRYAEGLARCESTHLFVTRPAYGYLVVRYALFQHGFSSFHAEGEPTLRRFADELDLARRVGAGSVFEAPGADARLAEAFARELGARVLPLDPLEGLREEDRRAGRNYLNVMDANLASLRDGLGCR